MPDYMPGSDIGFDQWFDDFTAYVVANFAGLGLIPTDITILQLKNNDWNTKYDAHIAAKVAARGATEMKDNSRKEAESFARSLVKRITNYPGTTDLKRELMGITVPDTILTPLSEDVVFTTPTPTVIIDHSQPRMAIVHFGVNPQKENKNAKPPGIKGAKIWYHIGGLPTEGEKWDFLADDTNSPYTHIINNDEPITIAYRAQYFDRRMRLGPLGDPITVAISA